MRTYLAAGFAALSLTVSGAFAQSISPTSFTDTIAVSETTSENFTITLPPDGPATSLVDVVFLSDNTGSMGGAIANIEANASAILGALSGSGADINYAVTSYFRDPSECCTTPGGPVIGNSSSRSYNLLTPMTGDTTAVQNGINGWFASGGGDGPEGGLFALHQIATAGAATDSGVSTGLDVGFRDGAAKVVVWFGDIGQHTDTVSEAETIAALNAADITVIAIGTRGVGAFGSALNVGGDLPNGQADRVAAATGGTSTYVGAPGTTATSISDLILDEIEEEISTIDLELVPDMDFAGLDVMVTCVSPEGCDDVEAGESRVFSADFTGLAPGVYEFDLVATGLAGVLADIEITVTDDDPGPGGEVPLPAGAWLLLTGLGGLGAMRKLRNKS